MENDKTNEPEGAAAEEPPTAQDTSTENDEIDEAEGAATEESPEPPTAHDASTENDTTSEPEGAATEESPEPPSAHDASIENGGANEPEDVAAEALPELPTTQDASTESDTTSESEGVAAEEPPEPPSVHDASTKNDTTSEPEGAAAEEPPEPPSAQDASTENDRANRIPAPLLWGLLALIVLLALALRFTGVSWDNESRLHPDERFITGIVAAIGKPENLTNDARENCPDEASFYDFFNTECSVYNPNNVNVGSYAYGTLPLYIVRGAAQVFEWLNLGRLDYPQAWSGYDYIHLVGRIVSALADTLVVVLVFLIGRRLFTDWHGLIAALLYACAVLPIQLAHFWAVDSLANLFFTLGLYAAVEVSKRGKAWGYLLFGVALGCAVASRVNLAPMAALLPLAVLIRLQTEQRLTHWRSWLAPEVILVLGSAAVALLVFRVGQPYAFAGPTISNWTLNPRWLHEIEAVSNMSRLPSDGWPPSVQWFGRTYYVYPWTQIILWGMGVVAGIAGTLGVIAALVSQGYKRRLSPGVALLSLWVVGYFVFTGGLHQMTMRYYLPLYAPLLLLATWFTLKISSRASSPVRRAVLPALLVGATMVGGIAFVTSLYTQPITRVEASAWINNNLPSTILLSDGSGSHVSATIDKFSRDMFLLTAFNGESYISEPFELVGGEPVRLQIQFADPRETNLRVRLLIADGEDVLKEWELQTDEQGYVEIPAEDMPSIEDGTYAWHIASEWSDFVRTNVRGMQPPVILRSYLPIMTTGSDDAEVRQPVIFRSPYQRVPYIDLAPDRGINLRPDHDVTITEFTIAHVFGDPGTIILSREDGENYIATPVEAETNELPSILGAPVRYVLDRPLEMEARSSISLRSETPMLITGTTIALDGDWEDAVPTRYCDFPNTEPSFLNLMRECIDVNGFARNYFVELKLNMAETDNDVKYRRMVDVLSKADYIVISSNRFYDAQPRVLRRFAMSTGYYDRLFAGELGYSLLNTFRRGSNVLGIEFPHDVLPTDNLPDWMNELEAEEAFTVYDHPTVFVFENEGFERYMLPEYVPPLETDVAPTEQTLTEQTPLPAPTYELATRPQSDDDVVFALLIWSFGFILLGWVSFPLMYRLFPSLPLAGFPVGRALSWLLLSVIPWWLTSVAGRFFWTRPGLWLLLIAFVALNAVLAYRRRAELIAYVKAHRRSLFAVELIFLVAFGIGLLLRAVNPDLWLPGLGGEKHMDFAYLNAVLMAPVFPPPNPWMAGLEMNYYYFGFVIAALPIKVSGIASEVGYNLTLASLYPAVFMTVFTLGYALVPQGRRWIKTSFALIGTSFAMIAGNLGTLKQIIAPEPGIEWLSHRWYWYPTRILGESENHAGGAINEIPLFSFLFGDLHAHILGLLPTMLLLLCMWVLAKQKQWWLALLVGVIAGTIYMTNIWDVLLYAPVGAILLWMAARDRVKFIIWGVLIALGAAVTVAPYLPHLALGSTGIEAWNFERSLIEPFLLIWGIPIGIATLWMFKRAEQVHPLFQRRGVPVSILLIVVVILLALDPILATTVLCLVLAVAAALLAWRDVPDVRLTHIGFMLIFAILLAMEYIVVKGDVGRMNTVFKLSFQLWMWVGLLIPPVLYWTFHQRRYLVGGMMLLLIGFGLLFPIFAVPARANDRLSESPTLDGDRFFEPLARHLSHLPEGSVVADLELIRYLRAHSQSYPVIAEWYESEYQWNGRMSSQTGLPAIVGWANHMRQQYGTTVGVDVDARLDDMRAIYLSEDIWRIRDVLENYNVTYIIVGSLERLRMAEGTQAIFDELVATGELKPVFSVDGSVIYQVVRASESSE